MTGITRHDSRVLAKDVRPGDRIIFGTRRLEVWRTRPAGAGIVSLDLHGVYLRLAPDQPLCLARESDGAGSRKRELVLV